MKNALPGGQRIDSWCGFAAALLLFLVVTGRTLDNPRAAYLLPFFVLFAKARDPGILFGFLSIHWRNDMNCLPFLVLCFQKERLFLFLFCQRTFSQPSSIARHNHLPTRTPTFFAAWIRCSRSRHAEKWFCRWVQVNLFSRALDIWWDDPEAPRIRPLTGALGLRGSEGRPPSGCGWDDGNSTIQVLKILMMEMGISSIDFK